MIVGSREGTGFRDTQTIGTTSTVVLPEGGERKKYVVRNQSIAAQNMYIGLGTKAVVGIGPKYGPGEYEQDEVQVGHAIHQGNISVVFDAVGGIAGYESS